MRTSAHGIWRGEHPGVLEPAPRSGVVGALSHPPLVLPGRMLAGAHSAQHSPGIDIPQTLARATVLADGTPAKPIQGAETMQRGHRFCFRRTPEVLRFIREPISRRCVESPSSDDDDPGHRHHRRSACWPAPTALTVTRTAARASDRPTLPTTWSGPHPSRRRVSGSPVHLGGDQPAFDLRQN